MDSDYRAAFDERFSGLILAVGSLAYVRRRSTDNWSMTLAPQPFDPCRDRISCPICQSSRISSLLTERAAPDTGFTDTAFELLQKLRVVSRNVTLRRYGVSGECRSTQSVTRKTIV